MAEWGDEVWQDDEEVSAVHSVSYKQSARTIGGQS